MKTTAFALLLMLIGGMLNALADSPVEIPPNWQRIGPYGGKVKDVEFAPSDPNILYALLDNPKFPIYRSTDAGHSWHWIDSRPPGYFYIPYDLAISPDDSDIFMFCDGFMIHRSSDGGITWDGVERNVKNLSFDPNNAGIAYSWGYAIKVQKSTDSGLTWSDLTENRFVELVIDPNDSMHLMAIKYDSGEHGLYQSLDSGINWSCLGFEDTILEKLCFGRERGVVYMADESNNFLRSADDGQTWTQQFQFQTRVNDIEMNPDPEEMLFVAISDGDHREEYNYRGVFMSSDAGMTWTNLTENWVRKSYIKAGVNPCDPQSVAIIDGYTGINQTFDGGANWSMPDSVFPGRSVSAHPSPHRSGLILAGVSMRTTDNGVTWKYTNFSKITAASVAAMDFAPNNPDLVYAITDERLETPGLFLSLDAGATWTKSANIPNFSPRYAFDINPMDDNLMLNGGFDENMEGAVARSTDGGLNWTIVYQTNDGWEHFADLEFAPLQPDTVYALKENWATQVITVLKSTDSGAIWNEVSTLPTIAASDLAISYTDPEIIYACDGYFPLRSTDQGVTWTELPGIGLSISANCALTSQQHPSRLWIGPYTLCSTDWGDSWKTIDEPKPYGAGGITYSKFAMGYPANPKIYFPTDSDGIWCLPDALAPKIQLAGITSRTSRSGQIINALAYVTDPDFPLDQCDVDILYDGLETGISLFDDGTHGDVIAADGIYSLQLSLNNEGSVLIDNLHLQLSATDYWGLNSNLWPVLKVKEE